jgi:hypothetical protein
MSFFEDASIVLIPSGIKNQKVYSVKPTDGTGDLTFSRASSATRVASNGLIEKVRTNLILQSETFENASWLKTRTSVTANATTAPNGTTTADKLQDADTTTGDHLTFQTPTTSGTIYTFSGYFKKAEYNFVNLHAFGLTGGIFNLDTGVVVSSAGGVSSIVSAGDGWYRCSFTFTAGGTSVFISQSPVGNKNYTGVTGSGIFLWGAQLEVGDIATDYIPTTTAAVSVGITADIPRLDYTGGGCPSLLLEPQRTNLALFSEQFDNAAWTKTNATITANSAVSPDGFVDADKLVGTAILNVHIASPVGVASSAGIYTASAFFKKSEYNFALIRLITDSAVNRFSALINLTTGAIENTYTVGTPTSTSVKVDDYGGGWYRLSVTSAHTIGDVSISVAMSNTASPSIAGGLPNFLADGTSGIYVWGAQLEAGSYVSSYIPTLGSSVTRLADAASKTGISSLIGQTEGTIYAEWTATNANTSGRILAISDGGFTNRIAILEGSGTIRLFISTSSVVQFDADNLGSYTGTHKIAVAYANNDLKVYLDGVAVATATTLTVPACSSVYVGTLEDGSNTTALNGGIKQALLFKTRLTNAQLAELTA